MDERLKEYKDYIESFLQEWYARYHDAPQTRLFDSVEYSLMAGGKRLRPVLAFEFCRMCGADWKKATPFAAAIEMIHTYSLIHDDLPCMDDDDYRRGRLTNHKVYGEAMAILAGDALLTDAFAVASTGGIVDAIAVLAECAGSLGMVGGQVLDIMSEERTLTEQEVIDIQTRKTGALINAACVTGAMAGGASQDQIAAAGRFAGALGMAFQIRDDMLDVIGDAKELGKATGVDGNKNTFVRLYGLKECEGLVERYTQIALDQLSHFKDTDFMVALSKSLTGRTF